MLSRAQRSSFLALTLLVVLAGCRDAGDSATPEEAQPVQAEPAAGAAQEEAAQPEPAAEPETPADPAPAEAEPADPPASVTVNGRKVEVRIEERAPAKEDDPPSRSLVVSIDGAKEGPGLLTLPMESDFCDRVEAVVEPVPGQPSPLVLAQGFCEIGEDEFHRSMLSAVIDIGDAKSDPRALWQGPGSFHRSFGACEVIDVPNAEVVSPGLLMVHQWKETIHHKGPDLPKVPCKAKKVRKEQRAKIGF